MVTDITERKHAEEALREAYENIQLQSEELQAQSEEIQVQYEELQAQSEDLREAYEALHESEEKYRMLFTNMTEAFFLTEIIYDKDGKPYDYHFLEVNPAYELSMGVKKEQILGKSLLEVYPNANPITFEKYDEIAVSGQSAHFEVFGELANKHFDVYAFSPKKGKFATIFRDISERKRAEERLRYHANLVDNVSDAIISTDKDLKIRSWNKPAERIYGWQADEVINLKGSGVLQTTFPEGLSQEAIAKDIFEKGSWEGELIQRAKDGRDVTVYAKSMALKDEAGVVIGGVSINYDITERKQMEEALWDNREDFDRAQTVGSIGSWRLDVRRNELTWSDENHRIFGIPKGIPLTYEIFLSMVHPDDREYVDDEWKAGLAGEPYDIEHRIIADGKIKWVREKAYIEFDKDGVLLGGFGIMQDITERKQAEEELRDSEERFRTMGQCDLTVGLDRPA